MRHLHDFESEDEAQRLADALFAESVPSVVRETRQGGHAVWVQEDDHLEAAQAALAAYLANPDDPRFHSLQKKAEAQRKEKAAEEKKSRHKVMRAKEAFEKPSIGWLTAFLIGASVIVSLITEFGDSPATRAVDFSQLFAYPNGVLDLEYSLRKTYLEQHQWYRLFTPMLLHLGWLHLIFNMWWLKDFGTAVEHLESTWKLLLMVVVINLLASTAQFFFESVRFGGFSGVNYGLFGYLWLRSRYDPTYPYVMERSTVLWLLVWFVLCFTNFIPVANTAHAVGLVVGALWGFVASGYIRRVWLRKDG